MNDGLSVKQTLSANSKYYTVALRRTVASLNSLIYAVIDLVFCRFFYPAGPLLLISTRIWKGFNKLI